MMKRCFVYVSLLATFVTCSDLAQTPSLTNNRTDLIFFPFYTNVTHLYEDIFRGYDKRIKPRINQSESVTVSFMFEFFSIIEFETASQELSVLGMFYFMWNDELLSWEPPLYDGVNVAKFPLKEVWSPIMKISQASNGNGVIGHTADIVTYASSGDATWVPEGTYSVICEVTIKFYPFDRQSCNLTLYVSDVALSEVTLEPLFDGVKSDVFRKNPEWKLLEVYTHKIEYAGVYLYDIVIKVERRTEYIMYTIVSPLILLSVLNIGVFIVPIDSGEKGSIAVTIFLSYEVFVSAINDDLPHNSINVCYLLIYIQFLLYFSVFAVIYSFAESYIYTYHADDPVIRRKKDSAKYSRNEESKMHSKQFKSANADRTGTSSEKLTTGSTNQIKEKECTDKLTWKKLLRYIDIIFFATCFLVVSTSTAIYFKSISYGNNL